MNKKQVIFIGGPTAVGKTDFVDLLADYLPIEIINMDVGQLYAPLFIGTAKPDLTTVKVPHHLFDVLESASNFSVAEYQARVIRLVDEITDKGKIPVFVGGSSFYLKSLLFPIDDDSASFDFETKEYEQEKTSSLWEKLQSIDPRRAESIHKNDRYRIERALAIWKASGKRPSEYEPVYNPLFSYTILYLTRSRSILYERINKRLDSMMEQGLLDEIRSLSSDWHTFLSKKRLIGYNELIAYLSEGELFDRLDYYVSIVKKRTRVYARKQIAFWQMLRKKIEAEPSFQKEKKDHIVDVDLDIFTPSMIPQLLSHKVSH